MRYQIGEEEFTELDSVFHATTIEPRLHPPTLVGAKTLVFSSTFDRESALAQMHYKTSKNS